MVGPPAELRPGSRRFCLQAWLAEVEGRLPARSDQARRQSGVYDAQNPATVNSCAQDRERYSICIAPAARLGASWLHVHFPTLESGKECKERDQRAP